MARPVEAIFFDVSGTLSKTLPSNDDRKREKVGRIMELLGVRSSLEDFCALLASRRQAYREWARESRTELSEIELWTRWMLPDHPAARVEGLAVELNQLWRDAAGMREMYPEVKEVLLELFRRGYRLGIVSNTLSTSEVPATLRELQISGLFEAVILSCMVGIRKPDPAILINAASRVDIEPEKCAYVGNRHDRDVSAARAAGFSKAIIVRHADSPAPSGDDESSPADYYVQDLRDLLEIFPIRQQRPLARDVYDASFSTMWGRNNFPALADFFDAAGRLGFARVELNHQIDSAMLREVDFSHSRVSSVHEPCPADISTEHLKDEDWLISSTDEERRARGVAAIRRSIDLADELDLPVVVVHCGMVSTDLTLERRLHKLFEASETESDEYTEIRAEMAEIRRGLARAHLDAVRKSLFELLDYAGRYGIFLGLENRYHYFDIPSLDEMGELLDLADASRLGFVYDVGHAQHLDRLGFYAHEDWLRRHASRIIEVHLHDVKGINDHLAPGLGEVDFRMVAAYLPDTAIRTFELQPANTPEQVKAGLKYLAERGCIQSI